MFCPNCGAEIQSDAKYCRNCGAALGDPKVPPTPSASSDTHQGGPNSSGVPGSGLSSNKAAPKKGIGKPFAIVAVVVALCIGFGAAYFLFHSAAQNTDDSPGGSLEGDGDSTPAESKPVESEPDEGTPDKSAPTEDKEEKDYSRYVGTWSTADAGWLYGGRVLDLSLDGNHMYANYYDIEGAPASRTAQVDIDFSVADVVDGSISVSFTDDGWGNSGVFSLTFKGETVTCELKDIVAGPAPIWGVFDGTFDLSRNDNAHAAFEYTPEEYEQMFPSDTPDEGSDYYETASSIISDLGFQTEDEFKQNCMPAGVDTLFALRDYPEPYIGNLYKWAGYMMVTEKGVTADGLTAYIYYIDEYNPTMAIIDKRDSIYSPTISVNSIIVPYMRFSGVQTVDGIDFVVFDLLAVDK